MITLVLVLIPLLFSYSRAAIYGTADSFIGAEFLTGFTHEAIADPTNGRVNYVNEATALRDNLTFVSRDTLILRADSKTTLTSTGPGRNSVRIRSVKTFTKHVAVFDIRHMPQGCATWPAAWETLEADWPDSGEVDIVEGINDVAPNQSTLHTSPNCTMPASRPQIGTVAGTDCNTADDSNSGCGVKIGKADSYGPAFNAVGGGWYAMERTSSFIRVFFWARNDRSVPFEVSSGSGLIDTDTWGEPVALFPSTLSCDLESHFGENNIIINLTLCGDWAGQASLFNGAGCPGDCVDFVNANPSAFVNAYWDIASLRVYT